MRIDEPDKMAKDLNLSIVIDPTLTADYLLYEKTANSDRGAVFIPAQNGWSYFQLRLMLYRAAACHHYHVIHSYEKAVKKIIPLTLQPDTVVDRQLNYTALSYAIPKEFLDRLIAMAQAEEIPDSENFHWMADQIGCDEDTLSRRMCHSDFNNSVPLFNASA